MKAMIKRELEQSASIISSIDPTQVHAIADAMTVALKAGSKVVFFGNGGSAADAMHLAAEFNGRYLFDRPALKALSFCSISAITAIGNDYSYDDVFCRNVESIVQRGDVVVGISTSGSSKNVLKAIRRAKEMGAVTVGFTGIKGALKDETDLALTIPTDRTPRIQEGYMAAGHVICGLVENAMFAKKAAFIDRDDTIVKDVPYCPRPEDLKVFPGVGKAIKRLNDAGYLVIIVTNQSGVARGKFTEATLAKIHEKLRADIAAEGGKIDAIYYCPHHPDEGCKCRKPNLGMIERAIDEHHISLGDSFIIGDSAHDVELGKRLGIKAIQVSEGYTFVKAIGDLLKN
ncbi:MAG: D,D-heptose 1,7-bisphosphate phosphatase [Methanomassiliicoccales archaeon PtaU1.Bin124]|nr:MAG: D,D-heptose 1,7-bisphosphate phosphatase [Methanomassiliicoccales archaeon PtaU1.Bin124]